MNRVHIIGPPRSGTTLMLELMSNCFNFGAVCSQEVSVLEPLRGVPEGASLCTKNPQDHRLVPALIDLDEQQWFISLVRDPRDIVCSRHGLRPEVYWANLRQWRAWLDNTRPYRGHPRLVEVRYETLVTRPDAVQRTLMERLPFLAPTYPFSRYHEIAQPSEQSVVAMREVRPISATSLGRWRQHLPRVAGQIEIHGPITEELIELGYEADDGWLAVLEGIEADTSPGHWPEFVPGDVAERLQGQQQQKLQAYLKARGL